MGETMALHARQHAGHSHGGSGGGMNMPSYTDIQHYFWVFTGSIIAFAALINLLNFVLYRQRLSSLSSRPRSLVASCYATATAITRELSHASLPVYHFKSIRIRTPQLGPTTLVFSWLVAVLVFSFHGYDTLNDRQLEDIAYRVGALAIAQVPLLFLLAGKQNLIGYVIGSSYERLNWLHRWVSRIFWLTVTIHMSFWFRSWARFNFILRKMEIDRFTQTGFAAWVILTAIVLTSFFPIRKLSHEVFYVLHVILFAGFMGTLYLHLENSQIYFWLSVAIFFLDRFLRLCVALWANFPIVHGKGRLWANTATLTPLPGNITRLTIEHPVIKWQPGQHMFVSCHALVPLQSHPFTASTLPSDGKLEFLIQAQKGGTRRFHRWASKNHLLPASSGISTLQTKYIGLEGPYGSHRPLHQFDSVLMFAGSTGATFTVPLMRDLVQRWVQNTPVITRHIRFVWVIKSQNRLCWFEDVLNQALEQVSQLRGNDGRDVQLDVSVYVTCDEELEATSSSPEACSPPEHGEPKATNGTQAETSALLAKTDDRDSGVEVEDDEKAGCGPDGGCCCKQAASENGTEGVSCCCCGPAASSSSLSPMSSSEKKTGMASSLMRIHVGRPRIRQMIRTMLEDAEGESAVVSCGPLGLQDDVRRSVVSLSDERAVHKGTGAQGVYLHLEGFGY